MAHEIYIDNGRASIMYADEVPWHRLGQRVVGAATAAEAIKAANLDWEVAKLPLFATNGMHGIPVEGKYATVRADKVGKVDCRPFGIVSESYTPLQNKDAFEFFDTIVRDRNAAIYHTAGALGIGERIWILVKLPGDIVVAGKDITNKYLLLSNNHDGKAGVRIKFTPVRVVCNNTLTFALAEGGTISVPHYKSLDERLKKVGDVLGIINRRFGSIEKSFYDFAAVKLDAAKLASYLGEVFPDPVDEQDVQGIRRVMAERSRAEHFFDQGKGNKEPGIAGTLWAAYNGITEMVDHRVANNPPSVQSNGDSRRLNSIWFGQGAAVKACAYKVALDKLKDWRN